MSPIPRCAASASWASSLAAGLFPPNFIFLAPPSTPQGTQPVEAVSSAGQLRQPSLIDNTLITDLAVFAAPPPSDPWHIAHMRVCAHASAACAACSVAFVCCSCRALRFTPGMAPTFSPLPSHRSRSVSPTLFCSDVGNGTPPPEFDSHVDGYDDDAYTRVLAEADTCDNSSCPRGTDEPATYSITVEQFDEGSEETYDRIFRACSACNRSCRKSFMGHRIKSRVFDNSVRDAAKKRSAKSTAPPSVRNRHDPLGAATTLQDDPLIPGSVAYAQQHPADTPAHNETAPLPDMTSDPPMTTVRLLQDALFTLSGRPVTPAAFVATIRVRHDASCPHPVTSCPACSRGLVCCECARLFTPAVARHLACTQCGHIAFTCCTSSSCCKCNKLWLPTDSVLPPTAAVASRLHGGAGSDTGLASSPEPDIWTPSPRSSPDEIDDLTARANIALPVSCADSGSSRASSRASMISESADFRATPLPTPDFSSLPDDLVDGLVHPSFPERAILDAKDRRHFLGRGDLSVSSLRLYARRIFTDSTHWISAGHLLVDIFSGATVNGSRDDFCRFVLLVGTHLGFGDLAQSMSESLDVNKKMADEYMRLRDVATTWKQKAKASSKDAKNGRRAQEELSKARDDITAILKEREVFIKQRRDLLERDDQLSTELSRVHRDYSTAIDDNTKFAADIESMHNELNNYKDRLSMAEHHRDKAEKSREAATLQYDEVVAAKARDKSFYEARILALSGPPVCYSWYGLPPYAYLIRRTGTFIFP